MTLLDHLTVDGGVSPLSHSSLISTELELHLNLPFELGLKSQRFCDSFFYNVSVTLSSQSVGQNKGNLDCCLPSSVTSTNKISILFFFRLLLGKSGSW